MSRWLLLAVIATGICAVGCGGEPTAEPEKPATDEDGKKDEPAAGKTKESAAEKKYPWPPADVWTIQGDSGTEVWSQALAPDGSMLFVGPYFGPADFDPGPRKNEFDRYGFFVAKWSGDGKLAWVGDLDVEKGSMGNLNVIAGCDGAIYVAGVFFGNADFDPDPDKKVIRREKTGKVLFVLKLGADGAHQWVQTFGDFSGTVRSEDVRRWKPFLAAAPDGSIYVAAEFQGSVDLDPGKAKDMRTSAGSADLFVTKLDASGKRVWSHTIGGESIDKPTGIAAGSDGSVTVIGRFGKSVDFDPGEGVATVTAIRVQEAFVLDFDGEGAFRWVRTLGSEADLCYASQIAIGPKGSRVVAGSFMGTVDLDPGLGKDMHSSAEATTPEGKKPRRDAYVLRLSATGEFEAAGTISGLDVEVDEIEALTVGTDGAAALAGFFAMKAGQDPTTFEPIVLHRDAVVALFERDGKTRWTRSAGGHVGDKGRRIAVDGDGTMVITGYLRERVDLDPGPEKAFESCGGQGKAGVFVVRLRP